MMPPIPPPTCRLLRRTSRRPSLGFARVALFAVAAVAMGAPADRPDHAKVPGVVIAHSPKSSRVFLGSAGIVVLSDGAYLAKHDEFGPGSTEKTSAVTRVYRSTDRGRT